MTLAPTAWPLSRKPATKRHAGPEAYGDSALNPANIFARGNAIENLCCRIDDKLMRIKMRGITDETEDTVQDLIGYLILLKVALRDKK